MPLARVGIHNGQRVAVEGLLATMQQPYLDDFAEGLLSQQGFMRIARKVMEGEQLSVPEIGLLLDKASMPVLMKLVSLCGGPARPLQVTPAVVLPLRLWLDFKSDLRQVSDLACEMLVGIEREEVQVTFDELRFASLTLPVRRLIETIARCRPGLTLVGPSNLDLAAECGNLSGCDESLGKELSRRLEFLRDLGFRRLRSSSERRYLDYLHELGFETSLLSDVTKYRSHIELAEDLLEINQLSGSERSLQVWMPGKNWSGGPAKRFAVDQLFEFQVLRVLAIGRLILSNIPKIRASSSFLSLEAMGLAHHFGANDLGFGAFDRPTRDYLWLESFQSLSSVERHLS